jgi:hypothetical protein
MLRGRLILQGLTLRQAATAREAALVIRGLTQGQALRAAQHQRFYILFSINKLPILQVSFVKFARY